jgi:hypothetical protein
MHDYACRGKRAGAGARRALCGAERISQLILDQKRKGKNRLPTGTCILIQQ